MCFLPHRSLSSIITWGGLENDSSRQLLLTVWGLKANSPLLGKQGWWWPLLPKVRTLKNVFLHEFRLFGSGSGAFSIIQLCLFSLFSNEKMQFFCGEKALLTQITCCGLNKDWLSGFSLFRNTARYVLDSIGCTLFAVRTAIPVNEKYQPTGSFMQTDSNALQIMLNYRCILILKMQIMHIVSIKILHAGGSGCCVNVDIWE